MRLAAYAAGLGTEFYIPPVHNVKLGRALCLRVAHLSGGIASPAKRGKENGGRRRTTDRSTMVT